MDSSNLPIAKTCFIIFYKSNIIEAKIRKICAAFNANVYELRSVTQQGQLDEHIQENHREIADAKHVLDKNNEARMRLCIEVAQHIEEWFWTVRREKSVFHTLNLFKTDVAGHSVLRGRGWMLTHSVSAARAAIKRAHINLNLYETAVMESVDEDLPTPPTHFETNKYTVAFQQFVNTYGTPRYKEINPALFTAATFPFLFGVMYGDMGHGSCLALAGLYLILTEHKAEARETQGILRDIYVARYMLFAMGLMGVYAGMIYNDYFSIGLNMFGTKYTFESSEDGAKAVQAFKYGDEYNVYPFGVDPVWKLSSNELLFFNSMKMKMSVILGIFQMTFGVILRGMNAIYFKSWLDFFSRVPPHDHFRPRAFRLHGHLDLRQVEHRLEPENGPWNLQLRRQRKHRCVLARHPAKLLQRRWHYLHTEVAAHRGLHAQVWWHRWRLPTAQPHHYSDKHCARPGVGGPTDVRGTGKHPDDAAAGGVLLHPRATACQALRAEIPAQRLKEARSLHTHRRRCSQPNDRG